MTWDELLDEMDKTLKFPSMPNIFWMPIQTRTEMLATGIRSVLGIKGHAADRAGLLVFFCALRSQADYFATEPHGQPGCAGSGHRRGHSTRHLAGPRHPFDLAVDPLGGRSSGSGSTCLRAPRTRHNPGQPRGDQQ
ncbi:MAG: hypothetical protein ACREX9_04545 [Gammaproteobacteria bacterium]